MVKHFCDICKEEITTKGRLIAKEGNFTFEVLVANKGVSNAGDVCHRCIRRALGVKTALQTQEEKYAEFVERYVKGLNIQGLL